MLSALSGAQSGLVDASVRLDVAANNIANVNTAAFEPARVTSVAESGGGVTPVVTSAALHDVPAPLSAVDLVTELVAMMLARVAFAANASAFGKAAESQATALEVLA